jgi:hypothetical protein
MYKWASGQPVKFIRGQASKLIRGQPSSIQEASFPNKMAL